MDTREKLAEAVRFVAQEQCDIEPVGEAVTEIKERINLMLWETITDGSVTLLEAEAMACAILDMVLHPHMYLERPA